MSNFGALYHGEPLTFTTIGTLLDSQKTLKVWWGNKQNEVWTTTCAIAPQGLLSQGPLDTDARTHPQTRFVSYKDFIQSKIVNGLADFITYKKLQSLKMKMSQLKPHISGMWAEARQTEEAQECYQVTHIRCSTANHSNNNTHNIHVLVLSHAWCGDLTRSSHPPSNVSLSCTENKNT